MTISSKREYNLLSFYIHRDGEGNIVWPFNSLQTLVIEADDLDLKKVTRMIGMRGAYLRDHTKTWIREVMLVNCTLAGMSFNHARTQLEALGVCLMVPPHTT